MRSGFSFAVLWSSMFVFGCGGAPNLPEYPSSDIATTARPSVTETELLDPNPTTARSFGRAVSLFDDHAIVGVQDAAHVFRLVSGSTWVREATLTGPLSIDFGAHVAISAGAAVVTSRSAAHVFRNTNGAWALEATFTAGSPVESVALEGDLLALGVPADGEGKVVVYRRSPTGRWGFDAQLASNEVPGILPQAFGADVAISGSTLVAGAPMNMEQGYMAGAAFVFVRGTRGWRFEAKLRQRAAQAEDELGSAVALSGDTVALSARAYGLGGVHVYQRQGGVWSEEAALLGATPTAGIDLSLYGDQLAVGVQNVDVTGQASAEQLLILGRVAGTWTTLATLAGSDGALGDRFGTSVALSKGTAIAGAPDHAHATIRAGAAYVYSGL